MVIPFTLSSYNTAVKENDKQIGTFNLIYNQGFEVTVAYRKLFAFFEWKTMDKSQSIFWCNRTMYGWSHDLLGNDWACFIAVKQAPKLPGQEFQMANWKGNIVPNQYSSPEVEKVLQLPYKNDLKFIEKLNQAQNSWKAASYPELSTMTYEQVLRRSGYGNGRIVRPTHVKELDAAKQAYIKAKLPESFDWRKVNNQDFVSPVRNQGQCGSCYAFASMGMLEARVRIMTNNTQTPVFSPQEVVSCSQYAQGCEGGFPYLIAGKYAQDFGVVEEHCYPYEGKDTPTCSMAIKNCKRHYVEKYEYVGGYYGACSEAKMMEDLVAYGPMAVAIEVYPDFQQYKSGIYHHVTSVDQSSVTEGFNPFELTNHAVLVVGYGADQKTGEKYWIVKNSWGEAWGENGFVRIRRGTDEIAIESLAQQSFPIPQLQ
uniref:Dipeptidyl peptidase 1 n=1 Tax=Phallusia mammillata TaxID=59560 RepID=A0A6F9DBW1_9ASCI|nr:dipeptidyl peptidase 1-like [Phallusia mammillata]